jgi:hypothetical protein
MADYAFGSNPPYKLKPSLPGLTRQSIASKDFHEG